MSGTILVVDDEILNRTLLATSLEEVGHTVELAADGQQALDTLASRPFDAILLDLVMPGIDGFQVLEMVKQNESLRHIPVIVISAVDDLQSVVRCIEMGATDYLPKPFDPVLLHARINSSLAVKALYDQKQNYLQGLERELEIGRTIQAGFLPDDLPQIPGWDVAAYFEPAREVAGDFYDVFPVTRLNRLALIVGDVCDKGVGAALYMSLFRTLLRAMSTHVDFAGGAAASPEDSLVQTILLVNNYLTTVHEKAGMFATIFFGLLDPASGSLAYINAGHERPLLIQFGEVRQQLDSTGPAVGLMPGMAFRAGHIALEPGDSLLIFSDGVTDATDADKHLFEKRGLHAAVYDIGDAPAELLVGGIASRLREHVGSAAHADDITLLAVRRV